MAFIYRAEYYGITEHPDGIDTAGLGELILAKRRHGALDTIKMKFVMTVGGFTSFDTFARGPVFGGGICGPTFDVLHDPRQSRWAPR